MNNKEKQIRHEKVNEIAKLISLNPSFCKSREDCYECPIFKKNTCDYVASAQLLYDLGYRKERRGEWKRRENKSPTQIEAYCSICGRDAVYQVIDNKWKFENFCPHCGAKMKGE